MQKSFHERSLWRTVAFLCIAGFTLPGNAGAISDQDSDNLRALLVLSGFAVAGFKRDKGGLIQYGKSIAVTSATTLALKAAVDSERPNGEDRDSFPSGHVSTSIAGAAFLHKRYGPALGIPAYMIAAAISANRIDNDHHRVVDVLAGGTIAYLANTIFVSPSLSVTTAENQTGLMLRFNKRF